MLVYILISRLNEKGLNIASIWLKIEAKETIQTFANSSSDRH